MEALLLSVHVVAGIVFVGGSAVAASLFPRYAPVAAAAVPAGGPGVAEPADERNAAVARLLHRITRSYGHVAVVVPVVGIVLALLQG
ncbi:MAG: hypothetical protein ACRDQ0_16465, partial [Pseudonocardia sp.]